MEIEACNQWEKLIWPQKKQIKRGRISTFDITVNLLMSSLERVSGKKPEKAVKDLRSVPKKQRFQAAGYQKYMVRISEDVSTPAIVAFKSCLALKVGVSLS